MSSDPNESLKPPDGEGYLQQQRITDILEARRTVREKRREANALHEFGEIDVESRNTILRNVVEDYIMECEGLLRDERVPRSTHYWADVTLGSVRLGNGERRPFVGLQSIVSAPERLEYRVQDVSHSYGAGQEVTTEVRYTQISLEVLMNAYRKLNQFLRSINVDLQLEEDTNRVFGFEVVDEESGEVVEEVP